MDTNDRKRFAKLLITLAELFKETLNEGLLELYFNALCDLSIDEVDEACELASRECRFFPRPVELRELIRGTPDDAAARAWEHVENADRRAGHWTSVVFEDGAIAVAIEVTWGTWALCSESLPKLSAEMRRAKRKEFEAAYRRALRESKTGPKYLRGFCESNNLDTSSQWSRGVPLEEGERQILVQRVWIEGPRARPVRAEFDFYSGTLITSIPELLERPTLRVLPPGQGLKLLSKSSEEPIDPEDGKRILAEAVSGLTGLMRIPAKPAPLDDQARAARLVALREQAEYLSHVDIEERQLNPEMEEALC